MQPKRKAAANVFMEQSETSEEPVQQNLAPPAPGMPAPASASAQDAYGGMLAQREAPQRPRSRPPSDGLKTSEELQLEKEPIRVRETGAWFWRRVIVPPNAYVVHTRIGRSAPVTLGLGLSFRYNPNTDAYLVVPAAMQTIGIVAYSISSEKQGINVLAYVQWQINDFAVAYRKLDFSDSRDPLGIVNAQLREQAEAAIKDKIATMSVEDVLTDKEPIIEELTTRLRAVAEGRSGRDQDQPNQDGLGIKIVTVQIKEALVSSQRLWQDLQAPFRYEQEKTARISYLLMGDQIRQQELTTRQLAETSEAEALVVIERTKQSKQTEALEIRVAEEARRFTTEQEAARRRVQLEEQTTVIQRESAQRLQEQDARVSQETRLEALRREQALALERARLDTEASALQQALEVTRALQELAEAQRLAQAQLEAEQQRLARTTVLKQQESALNLLLQEQKEQLDGQILAAALNRTRQERLAQLDLESAANQLRLTLAEREVGISRLQQEVRNLANTSDLTARLVERLPELAAHMPAIQELKVFQTSGDGAFDALPTFLAKLLALAETLGLPLEQGGLEAQGGKRRAESE